MTIEIRVPQLPESVADATLVAWRKQPGEAASRDENLADLETDKVVLEVPAPANGTLQEILVPAGTTVKSGDLLAIYVPGAAGAAAAAKPASTKAEAAPAAAAAGGEAAKLSPAVRRLVEENKLDPAQIAASGKDGRLTKGDVVNHLGKQGQSAPAAATAKGSSVAATAAQPVGARGEQRVPMTRLRQRIAERLVRAQQEAALLTTFNEIDLTAINELRARYKDRFEKTHGVKLGFMSFFVKAAVEALKRFPVVNAAVEGSDIIYHEFYDIGVAVSTDRGLVVPVVRDADLRSFADIEKQIGDYGARARAGQLSIEELTGGTFTITNGGVFGSLLSTPIINAPQSAILGMHKIQDRPVAVGGQVVVRPMMYLALSYDHRIIDGRDSVQFLVAIKECLEDPGRMLIGI
ncbi:MAG: 2-oxoglutarate dehydrogenase complex dihydrolipoyllysine-residue succinyltransferase [Sinobacteraceae bacterium]|nr:2-oxoglutarate dehydrogenase complex dihydrolipoyllysine-residue succinyltransferase [Nevskiaceae bacterium]MCP5359747.1 2-oxoglutarate dehydrogenase complex dihydrolipoyllysine-residue succinyltransferase [Nevskiaceae bacterium]MCP5472763.1 2-oxoglutarate dehydrogenase complex dihydrolipoyllysine-residue succinyltransferase [Nevskiaceae bacterium]